MFEVLNVKLCIMVGLFCQDFISMLQWYQMVQREPCISRKVFVVVKFTLCSCKLYQGERKNAHKTGLGVKISKIINVIFALTRTLR